MKIEDYAFGLCRYRIKELRIIVKGIKQPHLVESNYISNIIIEKDYENSYFPFFVMDIGIPNWLWRAMKKDSHNIRAYIDFQKGTFDKNIDLNKALSGQFTSIIKGNFFVFTEDMTPDIYENEQKRLEQAQGTTNGMMFSDIVYTKISLYNEQYLFKSKDIINGIASRPTLVDVLTYSLNKSGISNILLSPPENYQLYPEFKIIPVTLIEQLDRICNWYAMYKNGGTIFFDFDKLYILNKIPKCTVFTPNEYTTSYLISLNQTDLLSTMIMGCGSDSKTKTNVLNIKANSLVIKSHSEATDQVFGNNVRMIDTQTGNVSDINSNAAKSIGSLNKPTQYVMTNRGGNISGQVNRVLSESNTILEIGFGYIDLDMLSPNKEFILTITNTAQTQFNGKYRCTNMIAIFDKEGDFYSPMVSAEFRK